MGVSYQALSENVQYHDLTALPKRYTPTKLSAFQFSKSECHAKNQNYCRAYRDCFNLVDDLFSAQSCLWVHPFCEWPKP